MRSQELSKDRAPTRTRRMRKSIKLFLVALFVAVAGFAFSHRVKIVCLCIASGLVGAAIVYRVQGR
jgi:hypothetical protein